MMTKPITLSIVLFILSIWQVNGQNNPVLSVESYQLENGLTIFLNKDTTVNRVFGAVMVNAGAKHEDPNATGMAHYLEHMLFKGTEKYGTSNWDMEKPHLDSINILYENLAKATDEETKKSIQQAINEQALKASKYGLPNEFDKMLKSIGGSGVNAFTNSEMTFYHNSFPGHELPRWLDLYSSRFINPVFRSFQSELEVVYEEKNRGEDDFENRVYREMEERLFPNLPYGKWDVIGTTEHLKNPSLIRMYQFFNENYVAGNMALILSGNFDPAVAKPLIKEKFAKLPAGKPKALTIPEPTPFQGEVVAKKRMTPVKAGFVAFQTVDAIHEDRIALNVAEYLLSNNSETGYINQLMAKNEMIYSGAFSMVYNDAGGLVIFFVPKLVGQSLKKAEGKIWDAIEKVQKGDFSEELLMASKNDLIKEFNRRLENVTSRGVMIGESFNQGKEWNSFIKYPEKIDAVSKEEVIRVAKKYFGDNRLKLISRTGFPKKDKLEKPGYKPIVTDQKEESPYYKSFAKMNALAFEPRFLDYESVDQCTMAGGHQIIASKNPVNDMFSLRIHFKTGRLADPRLIEAAELMNFTGAGDMDLSNFKEKLAALGLNYYIDYSMNHVIVDLNGREKNLEEGLKLINTLLQDPKVTDDTKEVYLNTQMADRKLDKSRPSFMARAMYDYAVLGESTYYLNRMTEKELKSMNAGQLVEKFGYVASTYSSEILFIGNKSSKELSGLLKSHLNLSTEAKSDDFQYLEGKKYTKNQIIFVNDKKARQSQIWFHVEGEKHESADYAKMKAFNQYFGGGFSGLVLQEIREYRSLAYSAGGGYVHPLLPNKEGRMWGFIGCQADKTEEAIPVMVDLFTNLPSKPERMESLRKALQLKIITEFPEFRQIPETVQTAQLRDLEVDPNKAAFDEYADISMEDITDFWTKNIKGKPYVITIYGDKRKFDLDKLSQYGEVTELKPEEIVKF